MSAYKLTAPSTTTTTAFSQAPRLASTLEEEELRSPRFKNDPSSFSQRTGSAHLSALPPTRQHSPSSSLVIRLSTFSSPSAIL